MFGKYRIWIVFHFSILFPFGPLLHCAALPFVRGSESISFFLYFALVSCVTFFSCRIINFIRCDTVFGNRPVIGRFLAYDNQNSWNWKSLHSKFVSFSGIVLFHNAMNETHWNDAVRLNWTLHPCAWWIAGYNITRNPYKSIEKSVRLQPSSRPNGFYPKLWHMQRDNSPLYGYFCSTISICFILSVWSYDLERIIVAAKRRAQSQTYRQNSRFMFILVPFHLFPLVFNFVDGFSYQPSVQITILEHSIKSTDGLTIRIKKRSS